MRSKISPCVAYAAPVVLASRYCGHSMGATYEMIAAGMLSFAAGHPGHAYSGQAYFLIAVPLEMLALLVIAWLTARLSNLERTLRALSVWHSAGV